MRVQEEVIEFIKENDVSFIRLAFCDLLGFQKNIAIMPEELEEAFSTGISFDGSAIPGFSEVTCSDLLLIPDPASLTVLPWRPEPGSVVRLFCDIRNPDGTDFLRDSRRILKRVVQNGRDSDWLCKLGTECEFYLFRTDEYGEPTDHVIDQGGYLDIAPLDNGENIRREICLCLADMGIQPESSHHEQGPGQNEVVFRFDSALASADNLLTFKSVVKSIAARSGLFASFMPKPLQDQCGSGLHVNISLMKEDENIFTDNEGGHSAIARSFIAGVLQRTPEMTLFLNPTNNAYERFGEMEAPGYVSWSHHNRSQLVRIPTAFGKKVRMELRSPDPTANPYLAFALILSAGFEGIASGLTLMPPVNEDLYSAGSDVTDSLVRLPENLGEAIDLAAKSSFVRDVVGSELLDAFVALKKTEADDYAAAANKEQFNRDYYFTRL